jgi:hypothetical protein
MTKPCNVCAGTNFTPAGKCRACKKRSNEAYAAKKRLGGVA